VTLTVADAFGEQATTSRTIVAVGPLAASFVETPNPSTAGSAVHFDASGSIDPGTAITAYTWSFGDGTIGSGISAVHSYKRPGSYTVMLVAHDGAGQTAAFSRTLTISKPPLTGRLAAGKTQRRAAVRKHGIALSITVSEPVSASIQILMPTTRNGRPATMRLVRASRRLTAGVDRTTVKLSAAAMRGLPSTGRVRLIVRVVLSDPFGQRLPLRGNVTIR
jgi:PKD repeat protein